MAENIPEQRMKNEVKKHLYPNGENYAELDLVKNVSRRLSSHPRAMSLKSKNPIRKVKKEIITGADNQHKHIPLILKKSKLKARTEKFFSELSEEKIDQQVAASNNEELVIREKFEIQGRAPNENCKAVVPYKGKIEKEDLDKSGEINICADEIFGVQGKMVSHQNNSGNTLVPFGNKKQNNFQVSKFVKIKHMVSILKKKNVVKEESDSSMSEFEENYPPSLNGLAINDEPNEKAEAETSMLTVASDEIPYNAEIVIGNNDSTEMELDLGEPLGKLPEIPGKVLEIPSETAAAPKMVAKPQVPAGPNSFLENSEEGIRAFELMKQQSERKLFLEREDREFCREVQERIRGIPNFGYRGYNAVQKFNYVMNLVPDESPSTIHALMRAFQNNVDIVLDHLRYIRQCRKMMHNEEKYNLNNPQKEHKRKQVLTKDKKKTVEEMDWETPVAGTSASTSSVSTRKKKISYDVDLSDNYGDDSDEDYVPGKDLTPKKKKHNKRRLGAHKKLPSFDVFECLARKAVSGSEAATGNFGVNEGAGPSSAPMYIPPESNGLPMENANENNSGMGFQNDVGGRPGLGIFAETDMIYKTEPIVRETLELVQFKKKREPNSHVAPPIQKFMYTHEGTYNNRYVALSKHLP